MSPHSHTEGAERDGGSAREPDEEPELRRAEDLSDALGALDIAIHTLELDANPGTREEAEQLAIQRAVAVQHALESTFVRKQITSLTPGHAVEHTLSAAMNLSVDPDLRDLPITVRKELAGIFLEAARICAEREVEEPRYRLGRILHGLSKREGGEFGDFVQAKLRDDEVLGPPELFDMSGDEFEMNHKFAGAGETRVYRGFCCGDGKLDWKESFVWMSADRTRSITTDAISAGDHAFLGGASTPGFEINFNGFGGDLEKPSPSVTILVNDPCDWQGVLDIHREVVEIAEAKSVREAIRHVRARALESHFEVRAA